MFTRSSFKSPAHAGKDYIAIADTDGFAEVARTVPLFSGATEGAWMGGMDYQQAIRAAHAGDAAGVAASDKLMADFEALAPVSRRWRTIDTVAGGAPNVGAYLAGSPLSMRRRQRELSQGAPLTIFVDAVSSAGISANDLKKRGAAALALVRVLGAVRPVTVYMVAGGGTRGGGNPAAFVMVRMDNPLDVSRAAFFLGHPGAGRGLAYSVIAAAVAPGRNGIFTGSWGWGDNKTYLKHAPKVYADAIGANVDECLYLAPPHLDDPAITNPGQWVLDMLAAHGGAPMADAA
jgi:hypothetical protein